MIARVDDLSNFVSRYTSVFGGHEIRTLQKSRGVKHFISSDSILVGPNYVGNP